MSKIRNRGVVIPESFQLCPVEITVAAASVLSDEEIRDAIGRSCRGDWGEVSAQERQANDQFVQRDGRVRCLYRSRSGVKFWIVTEAGHSLSRLFLDGET